MINNNNNTSAGGRAPLPPGQVPRRGGPPLRAAVRHGVHLQQVLSLHGLHHLLHPVQVQRARQDGHHILPRRGQSQKAGERRVKNLTIVDHSVNIYFMHYVNIYVAGLQL